MATLRPATVITGKPLRLELQGLWSARRGSYRVVYRIDESRRLIQIVTIDHRSDVYRRARRGLSSARLAGSLGSRYGRHGPQHSHFEVSLTSTVTQGTSRSRISGSPVSSGTL
ncbi:MAG: type II toxin-antitoxin system RelE/ParE family toxin [Chloroflexota bacterium]